MNRQDVEKTITEYLKPIFGFSLKRCKSIHDAEDLSQEIVLRAFRALLIKDDVAELIADPNSEIDIDDNKESICQLQSEIAYLSKLQRLLTRLPMIWVFLRYM